MSRRGSNGNYSLSSLGLGPLSMNRGEPHPEEWTLVGLHKMEKREDFGNWFLDLQATILNCANQLTGLLEEYPHPNADCSSYDIARTRHSLAYETFDLQRKVYETRIPHPPMLHRVVTVTRDKINPGIRYY